MGKETPNLEPAEAPRFTDVPLFPRQPVRTMDAYGHGPPAEDALTGRKRLAHQYLQGRGVEFGALHAALDVPLQIEVRYADLQPAEELRRTYPYLTNIMEPDIITDLESMHGIDDESEDFVIACHVMEHVEDPFRALRSINRVLRPNGIAFIALPDKRFTFDKDRKITSLGHLIKDHEQGPDWSRAEHYYEYCRCVDGLTGAAHAAKAADMMAHRTNIHFHVWDYPAMMEMFAYAARLSDLRLEIALSMLNTNEVVWLLRKAP